MLFLQSRPFPANQSYEWNPDSAFLQEDQNSKFLKEFY